MEVSIPLTGRGQQSGTLHPAGGGAPRGTRARRGSGAARPACPLRCPGERASRRRLSGAGAGAGRARLASAAAPAGYCDSSYFLLGGLGERKKEWVQGGGRASGALTLAAPSRG